MNTARRIVAVPPIVPLTISIALSGLTITRGFSLIELGPGLPHTYQHGFEAFGYASWGWLLITVSLLTLVACVFRPRRHYLPLQLAHAAQAVVYGIFTSLVIAYGHYPGATVAWISTLLYASMHMVRVISLIFERLTELELPHGPN